MPKPQSVQVSIPSPCQQVWDEMEQRPGGRFCTHCQHVVRDLSGHGDEELARLMLGPDAPHCGRVRTRQLGRVLSHTPAPQRRLWPRLAVGALLGMASLPPMLLANPVATSLHAPGDRPWAQGGEDTARHQLTGVLVDAMTGQPIPFASVECPDHVLGTLTDEQGRFALAIPLDQVPDTLRLSFRSYDYGEAFIVTLHKADLPSNIAVALESEPVELTLGVMVSTRGLPAMEPPRRPLFETRKEKAARLGK